jgi:hypothetical protein
MAKALYAKQGQPFLCAQGGYLIAGTDGAEPDCICGGTPPPPPPPYPCCDTHPGCCAVSATTIKITVTVSYFNQTYACNNNANCGPEGWKSLTTTASGNGVYTWPGNPGACCPDTGSFTTQQFGTRVTILDLPEGQPCGGGVQSTGMYSPVGVGIFSAPGTDGIVRTTIVVKAALGEYRFSGCASGSYSKHTNNGTRFSSSCGTSPMTTTDETVTITVEGLAACGTVPPDGGGGGAGRPVNIGGIEYPPGWVLNSDGVPIPPSHNCTGCGS